ncbi:glycosyltransferase [Phenylobacterium montanum]|uniref:Glycosyltransferase n=1 Tax=Phenylobacterium montanum TaxID=2823693 RepID=A0A975G2E5_9CAUL|nr:glycosyltransferase [Caulobacter sp. S6]QUD89302.1 glycosyltransferase [Caulobacter sp. S6]
MQVRAKPKVAFYLPGFFMGGAERHTLQLCAGLSARGFETLLLAHGGHVAEGLRDAADGEGVRVLGLRGMTSLRSWVMAYKAFRAADADIIVAVNEAMAIRAVLLRALGATRAKLVCTFHSTLLLPADERRLPLFRLAVRWLDTLVFVSRNQMAHWRGRRLRTPTAVAIPNGVDLERFDGGEPRAIAKQRLGLKPEDYVVGVLASFRPEKNHELLLRAARRLIETGVDLKLLFVGDGPRRRAIEALVQQLELTGRVIFAGEHADVRPVIAAFDVGVICSSGVETFSLAALEVLASGAPMVMSDIGGASEIVTPGENGFLFENGDIAGLTESLATLADPEVRARLQAQARPSVERYDLANMIEAYDHLLCGLLQAGNASDRAGAALASAP